MGCLFACFRVKDRGRKKNKLISKSVPSKNRIPLATNTQLKNVIFCEDPSSNKQRRSSLQQNFDRENAGEELENEVELMKSCSVQLETPVEIQKVPEESNIQIETIGNDEVSINAYCRTPRQGYQLVDLSESKPERLVQSDEANKVNSSSKLENHGDQNLSLQIYDQVKRDASPYATPLSLSEDMYSPRIHTPVSVGKVDSVVETEYVCPILNQSSDKLTENSGTIKETPQLVIPSLSEWLKPPTSDENWKSKCSVKSPNVDRPIIGLVATHWNENEPSRVSPKWFDGNGIPNSTNKYKEDQKVSWHATPFEERLEKALSDEKLFPRRGLSGGSVNLTNEGEECDTAVSKPQLCS